MPMTDPRTLGTTVGLAQPCGKPDRPEQVYVKISETDTDRPVVIEGWVGYAIPMRMCLTARQARELLPLLAQACAQPEMTGTAS
jgi:hypothetical protein